MHAAAQGAREPGSGSEQRQQAAEAGQTRQQQTVQPHMPPLPHPPDLSFPSMLAHRPAPPAAPRPQTVKDPGPDFNTSN
jgi:hypothetical protein